MVKDSFVGHHNIVSIFLDGSLVPFLLLHLCNLNDHSMHLNYFSFEKLDVLKQTITLLWYFPFFLTHHLTI